MHRSDKATAAATPAFLALSCVGFLASAGTAHAQAAAGATDTPADSNPAPTGPRLGGVTVTGTAISEQGYKAERIESPKAVAPLLDTPRSVVVIDSQVIKETGSATLVDALRTVPGITFGAAEGGNPMGDRPFIRGFDSEGSTFVDGVRDIAAQSREVFAVDQIQIVRGSDSTLGGRGSAGGSINIISKLPRDENFISGDASFGNASYKRITADANWKLADNVAFRIEGMWHDQDVAGRDAIWQKRWGVAPSLTVGIGTPTRLTVAYYHLTTHELPDSGFPYLYTIGNAPAGYTLSEPAIGTITTKGGATGYVSRDTFYGLADRDFRDTRTDQATLRVEHDFAGGITLRNTSRFSHNYQAYIYTQPDDSQGNVFGTTTANPGNPAGSITTGGYVWRRANTRYGYTDSIINQTDLYGTFETGAIKHSFSAGAEFSWEKARRGTFVTRGFLNASGSEILSTGSTVSPRCNTTTLADYNCTSLFNPNPYDPWVNYASDTPGATAAIVKNLPIAETQNDASTQAVYAFDSISLTDNLIANLGIRFDRFHSVITPGQALTATTIYTLGRTDNVVNYQAGLVYKPTANTSLYASYATSSTPPNSLIGEGQEQNALATSQTLVDSLKVERTRSMEVGAKADLLQDQLSLTLAVFQTKANNARATGPDGSVQFIGNKRVRGVEFGFNGNITEKWNVFGGYTYLDAKITDGGFSSLNVAANGAARATTVLVPSVNTGRQFPQTAKHSFTAWTNYEVTPALSIGGGAFYTSRVYGGYSDNRTATQTSAGVITVNPATSIIARSIPGYWRFDGRIAYKVNDHFSVSVNGQNLTNKTYFTQAYSAHYATIAAGRTVFGTISVKY